MSVSIILIIIPIIGVVISFFIYLVKKGNIHNEVKKEYDKFEKNQDWYIEKMSNVIENESFKIWASFNEEQYIELNIDLIIGNHEDYSKLDSKSLKDLLDFAHFLLIENNQFPLFLIGGNKGIITSFNDEGRINGTALVNNIKEWKKEILNDIKN